MLATEKCQQQYKERKGMGTMGVGGKRVDEEKTTTENN